MEESPAGHVHIEMWQEKYGTQDQSVTLAAKQAKFISFVFKAATIRPQPSYRLAKTRRS